MTFTPRVHLLAVVTAGALLVPAGVAALRNVDFALNGVDALRLAGVDLSNVRSYSDISVGDGLRLVQAVSARELPLELRLDVEGTNPAENSVTARMVEMDWTLLLEGRETVTGGIEREVVLPPGQPTAIPLTVSVNLIEFFEGNARDLFELALSLAGQGGESKEVALRILPTVSTPLGPIRYPNPVTIVNREIGGP